MKPVMRTRFSEPNRVTVAKGGESQVQQHMKEETDINTIVSRYLKTGVLGNPSTNARQPMFGDFTGMEYMDMRNAIADIDQQFMSLPAKVRGKFSNDPYQLIRFVNDPANIKESLKMGLIAVPEGHSVDKYGNLVPDAPQTDKAVKEAEEPAPKADAEANPHKKEAEKPT
jgi:phage internal scaffolding protein